MGYTLNAATGKLERVTTVTGTIHAACRDRIAYDDTNEEHRRVRLQHDGLVTCPTHGVQTVVGAAYSGPEELLFPNPADLAEFRREVELDHGPQWWEFDDVDATTV